MKNMKWKIPVTVAMLAIAISVIVSPLSAAPPNPTLTAIPTTSTIPTGGGFDSTIYVTVPANQPVSGTFYNLTPAFIVQNISYTVIAPGQKTSGPFTVVNCSTPDYPERYAATTCSGLYPGRNTGRAYWGSTTGIYFLGLVGFSIPATYTITFTVVGLYYSNSITLSASETVTSTK
jgi:hypothetical protein